MEDKTSTGQTAAPIDDNADPAITEQDALKLRRHAAGIADDKVQCGLALSGGGIRSATFCLGLLRAFAANGILRRFDYLSTVSGGGYAGAAFGRLYKENTGADEVEEGLQRDDTLFLWWLRSNGRYLIPHGFGDMMQALSTYLRGIFATQLDVTMLALGFALCVIAPHLAYRLDDAPFTLRFVLPTIWWTFSVVPLFVALCTIVAYWASRDRTNGVGNWIKFLRCVVLYVGGYLVIRRITPQLIGDAPAEFDLRDALIRYALPAIPVAGILGESWQAVLVNALTAEKRIYFTTMLTRTLTAFLFCVAFGLLDWLSWIAVHVWLDKYSSWFVAVASGIAGILIFARQTLPEFAKGEAKPTSIHISLHTLANVVGLFIVALVVLGWLIVVQAWVFNEQAYPGQRALFVFAIVVIYVLLTFRDLDQLNWSSLHPFFRSRLARTYISVGNYPAPDRERGDDERFPISPLHANDRNATNLTEKVTRLLKGDDVALKDYTPFRYGGPIHLINCCINQTKDDRTGNYNADRKGVAMAVSSLGVEIGTHLPIQDGNLDRSNVSQWIAVSGAAVGSGMGSHTGPGMSALLFMSGLRLGFWWRKNVAVKASKFSAVFSELFARFPGLRSAACYLSDGGHFDNTGVYALLKRRLPLIVLADCGADPDYLFGDLENLVRKAKIDYTYDIEFLDPTSLTSSPLGFNMASSFGIPDTIGPDAPADECFLLARITYDAIRGEYGTLLVIKPRRLSDLPLDVAGYADAHPGFPQQHTGNQFFDEAQWESYERLGWLIGKKVSADMLSELPGWTGSGATVGSGLLNPTKPADAPPQPTRRQRIASTVGTSLGIGAVASIILTGWQLWDQQSKEELARDLARVQSFETQLGATRKAMSDKELSWPEKNAFLMQLIAENNSIHDTPSRTLNQIALDALADDLEATCKKLDAANDVDNAATCEIVKAELHGNGPSADSPLAKANDDYWSNPHKVDIAAVGGTKAAGAAAGASMTAAVGETRSTGTTGATGATGSGEAARMQEACSPPNGKRLTLYIQIYSEGERALALKIARQAHAAGMLTSAVEDVTETAKQLGKTPPYQWKNLTWLYHGEDGKTCAMAGQDWVAANIGAAEYDHIADDIHRAVRRIPDALDAQSNNIELWIPPAGSAAK
jgi:hypothetical protein